MTTAPVPYEQNIARHTQARDAETRVSTHISRGRLVVFLAAAGFTLWMFSHGVTPLLAAIAVAAFVVFGWLVAWHARVDERVAWHEAHRLVNQRALARRARHWKELPEGDAPPDVDLTHHPYALDLDLFGHASLFQWLGPAATPRGKAMLAGWLLAPSSKAEIVDRQAAVAHLAGLDDWRLDLAAHGVLAADAGEHAVERFLAWAEGEGSLGPHAGLIHAATLTITALLWGLIAADALDLIASPLWTLPLLAGLVLSFAMAGKTTEMLGRAGGGQHALQRYAALLEHAVTLAPGSPRLAALHEQLSAEGRVAPACMRRLNRILSFGELRNGAPILHLPIQALTLWDLHVTFALERWRRVTGSRVRTWLHALAELDALSLLATMRRDNPSWAVPEVGTVRELQGERVGHPLISDERRVSNDVTIGPPGSVLLITGSNMSGKSTLLRAVGLNIVLAQAGACVCAARLHLPSSDLQTSIRVQDSLEQGLSYFMAALARLKGVVDAAQHEREDRVLVYLLDEILQGTNSVERSIAVRAVTRRLLEAGAIGAMTTHDLGLADEEPLSRAATLVHFSEILDEYGTMRFDYTLKPGIATSRNALRLMQLIGIDL